MTNSSILYLRTAEASDARMAEQEVSLKEFAAKCGYKVSAIFRDNGQSGMETDGRDGLLNALNYIQEHAEVKALIAQNADRLARNRTDYFAIREFLKRQGVLLLSTREQLVDDSSEGLLMDSQIAAINAYWSSLIGRKVRAIQQRMVESGHWPFALPTGYKRNGRLTVTDGKTAKNVVSIFKLYQSGKYSVDALAKHLNGRNVKTPHGRPFTASSLLSLLKNPFYVGKIAYCGQQYEGRHAALVSREMFDHCQGLMHHRLAPKKQSFKA